MDITAEENSNDSDGMKTGPFKILSDDEISRDSNEAGFFSSFFQKTLQSNRD